VPGDEHPLVLQVRDHEQRQFDGETMRFGQIGGRASKILAAIAAALPLSAAAQGPMMIDWTKCAQPDLKSDAHQTALKARIDKYVANAKTKYKSSHIAIGLSRTYGEIVQERRDHVRLSYIPVGPSRQDNQCAMSATNYSKLIIIRDASYYVLCRSEVGVGTSAADRAGKDLSTLAAAAIYDLLKTLGADLRAKKDEPVTPPGGFAACKLGTADAAKDPLPKPADVAGFKSRMSLSAEEKAKVGDPGKQ
jgi:hypothetical protein